MMVVEGKEYSPKIEEILSLDELDHDVGTGDTRGFVVVWEV
jgi:hypothetical protein